jgi:type IV pilus assembly protein PilN
VRITLNLASRPFADAGPAIHRLRIALAVLAVVAIALGLGLHSLDSQAKQARARERILDEKIAALNGQRQGYQNLMHQPDNARLLAQSQALNQLFDQKSFSWTLTMEDLETVLPAGLQVSTLEPVIDKRGNITMHLRVLGPRDKAIDFMRNLEHSRRFRLARIVGETAEGATTGAGQFNRFEPVSASSRVTFDLLADYVPTTPEEARAHKKSASAASSSVLKPGHGRSPYTGPGPTSPITAVPFHAHRKSSPSGTLTPPGNPLPTANPNSPGNSSQGGAR